MIDETLFRISIKACIQAADGRILLVHDNPADPKGRDGFWDLPGGGIDPDEEVLHTLERELGEEIGKSLTDLGEPKIIAATAMQKTKQAEWGTRRYFMVFYHINVADTFEPVLSFESDTHAWLPPLDAAKLLAAKYDPDFTQIIAAL